MDAPPTPSNPDAPVPSTTYGPTGEGHARVLVVVDELDVRHQVGSVLGAAGSEVRALSNAAEAWGVLGRGGVDLVVMDLVLPDTDGRKFLMRLRERTDTATIPVVILSARDDSAIKSECFALGAEGFVGKPVDPEALVAMVDELARKVDQDVERGGSEDPLTGHLSRSGFLDTITAMDAETPVAVVLLELDGFEALSQRIGWSRVEAVLGEAGAALGGGVPEGGLLARWEGAEFIVLLPETPEAEARAVGEGLLALLDARPWGDGPVGKPLLASAGLASGVAGDFLEGLLETARYRLFRARAAGGGRLEADRANAPVDRIRVLVAEDDPGIGILLRSRLEREGFELFVHEDGARAHEAILAERPDLVLLDVRLPGMDGFDILASVRAHPERHDVPVIMITGLGRESDLVRGFELGADDYMVKPFSPTELLARIHRLLGRKHLRT